MRYHTIPSKKTNSIFLRVFLGLNVFLLSANGLIYGQSLTIETNLENAVQYIKQIFITNDGTQNTTPLIKLNADGQGEVWIQPGALKDNTVESNDLIDGSVTTSKIADGAITQEKMGFTVVGTSDIQNIVDNADDSSKQNRVTGVCAEGFVTQVNVDGTVACRKAGSGDIANGAIGINQLNPSVISGIVGGITGYWNETGGDINNTNNGAVVIGGEDNVGNLSVRGGLLLFGDTQDNLGFKQTNGGTMNFLNYVAGNPVTSSLGWMYNVPAGEESFSMRSDVGMELQSQNDMKLRSPSTQINSTEVLLSGSVAINTGVSYVIGTYPYSLTVNGYVNIQNGNLIFPNGGVIANGTEGFTTFGGRLASVRENSVKRVEMFYDTSRDFGIISANEFLVGKPLIINPAGATSGGPVGIGTYNPAYTFYVGGQAGGTTNRVSTSDKRLKKNIEPLSNSLDKIMQLDGVSYNWKKDSDSSQKQLGLIAQDVEKVIPEVVHKDQEGMYSLDYTALIPVLIETIKEQQKQINELKNSINK